MISYKFIYLEDSVHSNNSFITPWSFIHFLSGGSIYKFIHFINTKFHLKINEFQFMIIIHTIYEIKDFYKTYFLKDRSYWGDNTFFNSVGDTICAIVGYYFFKNCKELNFVVIIIVIQDGLM